MQESPQGSQVKPLKVAAVSLIVLLGLTVASWPLIKTYRKNARMKELLCEFVQVSDDFTRPKFYIHRSFYKKIPTDKPKAFMYWLGAYSDGRVGLPEIPATPKKENGYAFGREYNVFLNLEDRLFTLGSVKTTKENVEALMELQQWADELGEPETMKLKCRIIGRSAHNSSESEIIGGDFMLVGEELEAFLKTLELTRIFNEAAEKNDPFS